MKQLYSVLVLAVGVVAMPALADGHGDHRKGGERMGTAVKQMDANGDGEITREEVSNVATQRTEEALARFDDMDADGDGVVTQSERRRSAFNRMDGNGDGQITKNEFKEARKDRLRMMREQGRQRGHGNGDRKGMHKGHSESH